jgi:glycosyltransferase involved in cell wall biosynthesis
MARILVLGVKVPFSHGRQDVLVATLVKELIRRGHEADVIALPYNPLPKQNLITQAAMWRALDLENFCGKEIDLVIATKFPSYYARHPRKSVWLVHQQRSIYELYGTQYSDIGDDPRDEAMRRMLTDGDLKVLGECVYRSSISKNVADRLEMFNGLSSEVLYPPLPLGNSYRCDKSEPYILSVGRICRIKRLDMMINALAQCPGLRLKVVGVADEPDAMEFFANEVRKHDLGARVEFLGRVDDQELLNLYARSLAVFYAPFNEDYGYVTLEAMASGKPLITAVDSGGTLEFVQDGYNGFVVQPNPEAVAQVCNRLCADVRFAESIGSQGRKFIEQAGIMESGWDRVIERLLSPLGPDATCVAQGAAVGS